MRKMGVRKTVRIVTDWTAVAQNAVGVSDIMEVDGIYKVLLGISLALTAATAHTGTKIQPQYSNAMSGDEDWIDLPGFIGPTGTANTEVITNNPLAAGSTTATCASTTGLYDDDEIRQIYIKDGTIANSELVQLVSHVGNTSVTFQDGTTNAHAQSTAMWDIAQTYPYELPIGAVRARVLIDNTYDADGATVDFKISISEVRSLA